MSEKNIPQRPYWFVGSHYGKKGDQFQRFIDEGIWENGYVDRHIHHVKSMQVGDRIAIKASYTRKTDIPFKTNGKSVSVMAIKAIGTITDNDGNGRSVKVDWEPIGKVREWYFFTYRAVIWKVLPTDWMRENLIQFAFMGEDQDLERFRNDSYWKSRFGDQETETDTFEWTSFYQAIADKLLTYKTDRKPLMEAIHNIARQVDVMSVMQDKHADGTVTELEDICPFTVFALFNRGITNQNRILIAGELARFLGVTEPVPQTFNGIPLVNNQQSWFFSYSKDRQPDDINKIWKAFEIAIRFADADDTDLNAEDRFLETYQTVSNVRGVAWNLTMGLYWIRPWDFVTLDTRSRNYIQTTLGIPIPNTAQHKPFTADNYLTIRNELLDKFNEDSFPVHSFPALSFAAYKQSDETSSEDKVQDPLEPWNAEHNKSENIDTKSGVPEPVSEPYSVNSIIDDGCFLAIAEVESIIDRLRAKKNIILQGPPGTGKTWLGKRLAFALLGEKANHRVKVVQFHPNLSYEDFVRGYRPSTETGSLELSDGPFLEMVNKAKSQPDKLFTLVIEEINRGNPAQIFGELLTLLEDSKRDPEEALELCYRKNSNEQVYIPPNLFVIGTMNIADRSLALVDFALRRRFAFVDLKPMMGDTWKRWVSEHSGMSLAFLSQIQERIGTLNQTIEDDRSLGHQFKIGHSYLTPSQLIDDEKSWFIHVVDTELGPLLEEYWFDDIAKARDERQKLVEGL